MIPAFKRQEDKVEMFFATPPLIEAWNTAVRVRRGLFAIVYTDHSPKLYVSAMGSKEEVWQQINTRANCGVRVPPKDPNALLLVNDITERLAKQQAALEFRFERNKQKQMFAKLQIRSANSATMVATLATVKRGGLKAFGEFELTNNW